MKKARGGIQGKTLTRPRKHRTGNDAAAGVDKVMADVFNDHWLVESPRRVQFEKTSLCQTSSLVGPLEEFYQDIVRVPDEYSEATRRYTEEFLGYLTPRVSKLGNQAGLKVLRTKYSGSMADTTQVILPREVDVLVLFDRNKARVEAADDPGYRTVPLKAFRVVEGEPPDAWRYGRSPDGRHLSPMAVASNIYDLVRRALKLHPNAKLRRFMVADGSAQITVDLTSGHVINLIPASFSDVDDAYLVTRPYSYDVSPTSSVHWRLCFVDREKTLLDSMNQADCGMRLQAFKILKALFRLEPTLHGISTYHLRTVLLHTLENAVDGQRRWQRHSLEHAFLDLWQRLLAAIQERRLPNFFMSSHNLFAVMDERRLAALQGRIQFLLQNPGQLQRLIRKHSATQCVDHDESGSNSMAS